MKVCKCCGIEKPLNDFYDNFLNKDRKYNVCKECHYKSSKSYNPNKTRKKEEFYDEEYKIKKQCNTCGEIKFLYEFNKDKQCLEGHKNRCRECTKKYYKQYRYTGGYDGK